MPKKKTSKKRDFLFSDIKPIILKKSNNFVRHYPKESLKDAKLVVNALIECMKDGDADSFKVILATYLEIINKDNFSKQAGLSRRTLYRMLSPDGNPTFSNVVKIVAAIQKKAA